MAQRESPSSLGVIEAHFMRINQDTSRARGLISTEVSMLDQFACAAPILKEIAGQLRQIQHAASKYAYSPDQERQSEVETQRIVRPRSERISNAALRQ